MTDFDKWHDLQIAEARCADLQAELCIHRERWQVLVNAVADRFNRGLVVGNDDEAVNNALTIIRALPTEKAAPAGEG